MENETLAKCLSELGNTTRLQIFKLLVKAGENGLCVGQIQKELNVASSTLSHHISRLCAVNLLEQKREGTTLNCFANYDLLQIVIKELQDSCCVGVK